MSGFDTFRRVYSLTLYGVYAVGVLIYIINHIRRRNHIGVVQHGLATLTLESVNFLVLGAIYVLREWTVTARTPDDPLWGRDFTSLNKLATCMLAGVGWAVSYARASVILVKFTRVSAARFALFEVRTARGQIGVVISAFVLATMFWTVLELGGRSFCLGARLCGQRNALPNSYYLITNPSGIVYAALVGRVVEKAKRAGASEETSGILVELDICGKFVGSQLMLQNLLIVLADARVIPYNGGFEFFAFNHMMFVIIGLFYAMNVVPARRQGYSPFERVNQVWPEDADEVMTQLNKTDETSTEAGGLDALRFQRNSPVSSSGLPSMKPRLPGTTTPRRPSMEGESLHSSGRRSVSSNPMDECAPGGKVQDYERLIQHLMRSIHALAMTKAGADEASMQAALSLLARAMLNEEAVRCAAHLMRLLQLHGHTKDEREEARSIYLAIIQDHLSAVATLPIDVPKTQQEELLRLLTVSSRRRVIFQDDFMKTVNDLYPLLGILAPRVIPVLRVFLQNLLNDSV